MTAEPVLPCAQLSDTSLAKKHLPARRYLALRNLRTSSGYSLDMAIQSGIDNPDSNIGIYAGDKETYRLFEPVFSPIINEYHRLEPGMMYQPTFDSVHLPGLDPEQRFIRSSRVRVARNLEGFPFSGHMTRTQRLAVENTVKNALARMEQDLAGSYTAFADLSPAAYNALREKGLAFPKGDRFQDAAGINRDFPSGRGIFISHDNIVRVWVNEEDHLRIMAQCPGSDIEGVFNRLRRMTIALSRHLDFCVDDQLGFLTSCPTNIGTAMRAGVHICLEKLEYKSDILNRLVSDHHLQIRGTGGEKTAVQKSIFDISNARRLGVSANTIIEDLHKGLSAIIRTEKNL